MPNASPLQLIIALRLFANSAGTSVPASAIIWTSRSGIFTQTPVAIFTRKDAFAISCGAAIHASCVPKIESENEEPGTEVAAMLVPLTID